MSSAAVPPAARRKPWEEANPWVSGVLAYLVPGAGHLYQRRYFKGLVYLVCIHGAFFTGMCLGEGMTVHNKPPPHAQAAWQKITLSYIPQLGNGIWALPALAQMFRVDGNDHRRFDNQLEAPLTSSLTGIVKGQGPGIENVRGELKGMISLQSIDGIVEGSFVGTRDGEPVELALSGGLQLDRPIGPSPRRDLSINVAPDPESHPNLALSVEGTIPRPLWNWYEVPPTKGELEQLTGRLGKYFELALVFTWIAGLLNVLAVWDCVKGPSLGFGDEQPALPGTEPAKVAVKPAPVAAVEKGK